MWKGGPAAPDVRPGPPAGAACTGIAAGVGFGAMAIWLVRHGETEWSISGQHTGTTDIAPTPEGELQAIAIGKLLAGRGFDHVFASPMTRAQQTARPAEFGERIVVTEELRECDYGEFEGGTTKRIREIHPGWELFRDGCPGGETPEAMAERIGRFLVLWNRRIAPHAVLVADIATALARTTHGGPR